MQERLTTLLRSPIEALGYEMLGVQHLRSGHHSVVRVYIDSEAGISVDDCERVSRQVGAVLDVEDPIPGQYTLEVSSPGFDRPLFEPAHFERFAGHRVRIRLRVPFAGRRNFNGVLRGFRDGAVIVSEDGVDHVLPHDQIRSARLVPEE